MLFTVPYQLCYLFRPWIKCLLERGHALIALPATTGFDYGLGHARKVPVTSGLTVVFLSSDVNENGIKCICYT